jgi:hypothetical protein
VNAHYDVNAYLTPSTIRGYWSDPMVWPLGDRPELAVSAVTPNRFEIESPTVAGYDYDWRTDQPLVEVWAEKTTMDDVLDPLCRQLGVNYVPAAGTQSITNADLLVERSRAARRPVRVLYVSDFDKEGRHMPFTVARHVEYLLAKLGPVGFRLTPIVLTAEQVKHYELPPDPTREGAVELDALEALHPGELDRIVRGEIERLRDPALADRLADAEIEAQEAADEAWQEAAGELVEELGDLQERIDALVDRYRQLGRMLNDRLQAEVREAVDAHEAAARLINGNVRAEIGDMLARYRRHAEALNRGLAKAVDRLDDRYRPRAQRLVERLRRELNVLVTARSATAEALAAVAEAFDVELPERPGPELPDDPVERWLFADERDWVDQLDVWHRRAHGGETR